MPKPAPLEAGGAFLYFGSVCGQPHRAVTTVDGPLILPQGPLQPFLALSLLGWHFLGSSYVPPQPQICSPIPVTCGVLIAPSWTCHLLTGHVIK